MDRRQEIKKFQKAEAAIKNAINQHQGETLKTLDAVAEILEAVRS